MTMTIYLAAPMTGVDDENFPLLDAVVRALSARDWTVISPANISRDMWSEHGGRAYFEHVNPGPVERRALYLRADIRQLIGCNAIGLLPGWTASPGALLEASIARQLGLDIFVVDCNGLEFVSLDRIDQNNLLLTLHENVVAPAKTSVCAEAEHLVAGARQEAYGHPLDNWTQTARLWTEYLAGRDLLAPIGPESMTKSLTADDGLMMMVLLKVAREMHQHTRDNLVDIIGYAACIDEVYKERGRRGPRTRGEP